MELSTTIRCSSRMSRVSVSDVFNSNGTIGYVFVCTSSDQGECRLFRLTIPVDPDNISNNIKIEDCGTLYHDDDEVKYTQFLPIGSLSSLPAAKVVVATVSEGKIWFWNVTSFDCLGEPLFVLDIPSHTYNTPISFSRSQRQPLVMAVGNISSNGQIDIYSMQSKQKIDSFPIHNSAVSAIIPFPSTSASFILGEEAVVDGGPFFISSEHEGMIFLWSAKSGKVFRRFEGHDMLIECIDISHDGSYLMSTGHDKVVKLWRVNEGLLFHSVKLPHVGYGCSLHPSIKHEASLDDTPFNFNPTGLCGLVTTGANESSVINFYNGEAIPLGKGSMGAGWVPNGYYCITTYPGDFIAFYKVERTKLPKPEEKSKYSFIQPQTLRSENVVDYAKSILTPLQNSISYLRELERLRLINTYQYNLKLLLEQHKNLVSIKAAQARVKSNMIASKMTPDIFQEDVLNSLRKIRDLEKKLGNKMITNESMVPNWKVMSKERDDIREKLIILINEYSGSSSESAKSKTEMNISNDELEKLEEKMLTLLKVISDYYTENNIDILSSTMPLTPLSSDNSSVTVIGEKGKGDEFTESSLSSSTAKISSFEFPQNDIILIGKSRMDISWINSFSFMQTVEIPSQVMDVKKLFEELDTQISAITEATNKLSNTLKQSHVKYCEPTAVALFDDVRQSIQNRIDLQKSSENALDELKSNEAFKDSDLDRERELYRRKTALSELLHKIKVANDHLKGCSKKLKKIELDLLGDLTDQEESLLDIQKNEIDVEINNLKRERESLQDKLVQLSRNITGINESSSSLTVSVAIEKEDIPFDFPELPLLALSMNDTKSTKQNITHKVKDVSILLQQSGFLTERSLQEDYDLQNLPDEVLEMSNSPEVSQSSVIFCRLKGSNQQTLSNALKVLQPIDIAEFKTIRAAVVLASRAKHPYILPIETVFVDEKSNKVFVQTPLRMGGSMKRWLTSKKRPIDRKLEVLSKIADALDAVHIHGIVHRDIKLENVVMDSNDDLANPSICDFDTSRDSVGAFGLTTVAGKKIGTIRYMAPEIFEEGLPATKESDVWSFVMMMLIALIYDGEYDNIPMSLVGRNRGRVDIPKAIEQAASLLHPVPSYHSILDMFNQVLMPGIGTSRPSIKMIRDSILKADIHKCLLCEAEGIQPAYYRRFEGCECENNDISNRHFLCKKHFSQLVESSFETGEVKCIESAPNGKCKSNPFNERTIIEHAGVDAFKCLLDRREKIAKREFEAKIKAAAIDAENKGKLEGLRIAEAGLLSQVQVTRLLAEMEILAIPRCPRCKLAIQHVEDCGALRCPMCQCAFCAYCLADCGDNAHPHLRLCEWKTQVGDTSNFGNPYSSEQAIIRRAKDALSKLWMNTDNEVKREALKNVEVRGWLDRYQISQ